MPNRMLRDWTKSYKINSLSVQAERFFVRLIMKADDYGCFYADTRLLKADLFPLLLDSVRDADMARWIIECQNAGLIIVYEYESKKYLQIKDFNQRMRLKRRKFPCPPDDGQMTDTGQHELEVEEEIEIEEKRKMAFAPPTKEDVINVFNEKLDEFTAHGEAEKFINFYKSKNWFVGKNKMKNWKASAAGWILRMNDFKPKNNGQKPGTSEARILAAADF